MKGVCELRCAWFEARRPAVGEFASRAVRGSHLHHEGKGVCEWRPAKSRPYETQVQFGFDEDVRISVESEFRYFDGQAELIWRPEPGSSSIAARAVALLGLQIESFRSNIDGTLTLAFSNQHRLTILDSSKAYESYDITRPGQTIIV